MTRVLFFSHDSKYILGLPQGFRELNCPVFVLRDLSRSSIKEAVDHFKPDLMITTGWAYRRHKREHIDALVKRVAKYKVKHVYWATEDPRWTSLIDGNIRIEHTEHVLAAISGLSIDNVSVELEQCSLPVTPDYSSKEFTRAFLEAGIVNQPLYQQRENLGFFTNARQASERVVSIPVHPGLTDQEVDYIVSNLQKYA